MATKLVVVANLTEFDLFMTSSENPVDTIKIPAGSMVHTGGGEGDYVRIPDCSGEKFYKEHHILFEPRTADWKVALWNNDRDGHKLYVNPNSDAYSSNEPLQGTETYDSCNLLIQKRPGTGGVVKAFRF